MHQFQQQAEHRDQHDQSDLGPGVQFGVVRLEARAHPFDLSRERLVEPAPAEHDRYRGDPNGVALENT